MGIGSKHEVGWLAGWLVGRLMVVTVTVKLHAFTPSRPLRPGGLRRRQDMQKEKKKRKE
ncbi:hypothetical protein TESG_07592 [Trichophyton tonsurans CBS 112818]|uniref:Uncharacterized protein n=1 Tax=Trichophyton tonsurans (strain CBS 112818) TaxID=647933 RepID=F2S9P8_TRIT1|nr:hypothetical protein TESG_07592 [Trichophyton tonsurans CBS 112818]